MKAQTVLLIAVLIVMLAVIIYAVVKDPAWAYKGYWLASFLESPWQVYRRSDGTFDDAAQLALRQAGGRRRQTAADHLLQGVVISRNILAQEHRPETAPDGRPTPAAVRRARERQEMFGQARAHYMAALHELEPAPRPGAAAEENPAHVLDAVAEFAFGGVAGLLANDPLLATLVADDWDFWRDFQVAEPFPPGAFGAIVIVDGPLAAAASQRRDDVVRQRQEAAREAAREQGGAQGAAVDTYLGLAVQHTDDAQNAHDPGVLACYKGVLARLRADQGELGRLPELDAVIADLQANGDAYSRVRPDREARPALVADAVAVAQKARAGERVVSLGATDEECLRRVWARADDPRNAAARGKLRQALFDSLVDAWEPGLAGRKIVCVNGRATRILSALVLLDWDRRNWEVKRLEQFKNDIYEEAARVIAAAAARAAESDDPGLARAGRSYLAKTAAEIRAVGDVPEEAAARFAADTRGEIGQMVDDYVAALETELGAQGAVPGYLVEAVKAEAQAALV